MLGIDATTVGFTLNNQDVIEMQTLSCNSGGFTKTVYK